MRTWCYKRLYPIRHLANYAHCIKWSADKSAFLRLVFLVHPVDILRSIDWDHCQTGAQSIFTSWCQCRQRASQKGSTCFPPTGADRQIHFPLHSDPDPRCNTRTHCRVDIESADPFSPSLFHKCTSRALALFVVSLSMLFVLVWFVKNTTPRARVCCLRRTESLSEHCAVMALILFDAGTSRTRYFATIESAGQFQAACLLFCLKHWFAKANKPRIGG